jgi:primosomal protein N' (replication factor Y)
MMFYTVVTASRARSIGNGLTYKSDTVVDVGTLVRVPLRHARIEGIIVARPSAVQGTMNVKEIDAIVSRTPLLSQNFIEFLRDAADDSFATMRDMLTIALPKPPWSRIAVAAAPANPHDKITNGKPLLLVDHGGEALLERYRDAIADARKRGRQCLVLAPNATRARTLFHELSTTVDAGTSLLAIDQSRIMDERRVMEAAMHGTAALIVGLRSAVFLPMRDCGLIILDEENARTYKNPMRPCYHARDVAEKRTAKEHAQLICASTCPSLQSWYRAKGHAAWDLMSLSKPHRDASATIIDLREANVGTSYPLTTPLIEATKETLERGEKAIMFVNQRGVARTVICMECRRSVTGVDRSRVYEDARGILFVGKSAEGPREAVPSACPSCGSVDLKPIGAGTQRVTALLKKFFPSARIVRIDRDSEKESMRDLAHADILVGTQSVLPFLDDQSVTLASAVIADIGLSSGDFRASERIAGTIAAIVSSMHGKPHGRSIIQSFNPSAPEIAAPLRGDVEQFLDTELALRRAHRYPPVTDIVTAVVRGGNAETRARILASQLENLPCSDASIDSLRVHPSLTTNAWYVTVRGSHLRALLRSVPTIDVIIDVDPVDRW